MEENVFEGMPYLVTYPEGFQEDKKYPLVIFLHGAGTRGDDIGKLKGNKAYLQIKAWQDSKGFILLAPHCKNGDWNEWMNLLIRLVGEVRELPYIDQTHIHLTGNSMGGYGTWALSVLRPDWFASAMPVCGGGNGFARNLVDLPIRAFHGLCDTTVDPVLSLQMVKAVNLEGGHAELILFPKCAHNIWDEVYDDERNYDWLLSFTTERNKSLVEQLSGDYYG